MCSAKFRFESFDVYCIPIAFLTWQCEIFGDGNEGNDGVASQCARQDNMCALTVQINDRESIMSVDDADDDDVVVDGNDDDGADDGCSFVFSNHVRLRTFETVFRHRRYKRKSDSKIKKRLVPPFSAH